jgi:hypothetical protein
VFHKVTSLPPRLMVNQVSYDLAKIPQVVGKSVEIVLTTEDAAFSTNNDVLPPVLDKREVRFSHASAIVLRVA